MNLCAFLKVVYFQELFILSLLPLHPSQRRFQLAYRLPMLLEEHSILIHEACLVTQEIKQRPEIQQSMTIISKIS